MTSKWNFVGACALALAMCGSAIAGPDWLEIGDAGPTLGTAQRTFGVGDLNTIAGTLSTGFGMPDYEDMYLITVTDPGNFSMTVNANFNAQLWVFNVTLADQAFGLLGVQGPAIGPFSNDDTGAALTTPGVYAIAISGVGRVPVSINGEIFAFQNPGEISGPDGPGGINPHIDWTGVGETGSYVINFEGSGFYDIPAPGGLAVIAVFALAGTRRRRS